MIKKYEIQFIKFGSKLDDFPNSVKASREVLSLPMHGWITEEDVMNVVDALRKI